MAGSNDVRARGQILSAYYLGREADEQEDWRTQTRPVLGYGYCLLRWRSRFLGLLFRWTSWNKETFSLRNIGAGSLARENHRVPRRTRQFVYVCLILEGTNHVGAWWFGLFYHKGSGRCEADLGGDLRVARQDAYRLPRTAPSRNKRVNDLQKKDFMWTPRG